MGISLVSPSFLQGDFAGYRILSCFSFHRLKNVFPKYIRGENNPKLIPRGQYYPDTKIRRVFHVKRRRQTIILYACICKNPQQNTSKPNPTTHKRNYTLWSNRIYLRKSRWVQHLKIIFKNIPLKLTLSSQQMQI